MRFYWPVVVLMAGIGACGGGNGASPNSVPVVDYPALREAVLEGRADLSQVTRALSEDEPTGLANTLLSLYRMADRPWVEALLLDLWRRHRAIRPLVNWRLLERPAARVALAHTLTRSNIGDPAPYLEYIHSQTENPDVFVRAQVAVALGFVGSDRDIPILVALARAPTRYDAESAIKALGILGTPASRDALVLLGREYARDLVRGRVIGGVLVTHFPGMFDMPPPEKE